MRDRVERKLSTQGVGLEELKSVGTRPYSPSHEETVLPVEVEKLVHALRQRDSRSIGAMYELFPELLILAGGQRGAEAMPAPIEGKQEVPGISKSIFGKSHPEFDRAAVGILSLVDILEGSEAGWRRLTADTTRLSWETYQELSQQAQKWLPTPEHIHRAITCIIVSNATKADISTWSVLEHIVSPGVAKKTHTAIESIASNWMEKEVDVQIALGEALHKTEKISPSFAGLDKKTKNDFISALRTGFSIPQMMQLESPAGSLNQALSLSSSAKDLMCAHFLADLAGAIGHLDSDGSRTLTESTAQNFLQVAACLRGDNAKELYDNYVGFIAAKIGINCETSEGYAITRIAAMLRLDSPLEGRELEEAFNAIGIREREVLALELGKSGIGEETAILAYFSPALFNNLRRTFGSDRLNFQRACSEGMELLAECFTIGRTAVTEEYPLTNSLPSSVFRLDIGEVARATHEPGRLREKALKHSVVQEGRVGKVLVRDTEEILAGPSPLHFNAHRPNAALHSLIDAVVRKTSDRLSQKTVHMIIEEDSAEDSLNRGEFLAAIRTKSRHLKHQINALSVFLPKSLGAELPAQLTPPEEVLELMDPELNLPSKDLAPIPKPLKTALMALRIYLQECDFAVADNAPRAYHRIHELVRERINDLETWIGEHAEFFGKDENPLPTNYRVYQPKKVTAGLLESLSGIAHGQIYRPGDPRIIDFGNSSHLTRDEMIRHLDNGAKLHIVRDRLGYLSGEGIVFDSTMAERFKPEIVEPYIDTYERVGFIQYIGLHRSAQRGVIYRALLEDIRLHMDANVAVGFVHEDNLRGLLAHQRHGNVQLYVPHDMTAQTPLEIDQASLIPGTDTLRLFGIILPVSPRWRREFSSNEQSLTEMQEDARAMINRRLPGFYDRDFASFQKVWREQDERLLYRTTQLELRSSFQSLLAGEISPTQLLQDGDLKGKLMTALPRHSIHTLSRSGLFHSLGSGETTELDMKQAAEIALRHLPGESRLHEDIREISEWKKLVLTKLRDPKDTNKLLQDWIHLLLEDPTADSVMPR